MYVYCDACSHEKLQRSCDLCALEEELAYAKREIAAWEWLCTKGLLPEWRPDNGGEFFWLTFDGTEHKTEKNIIAFALSMGWGEDL